jgi:hypothetical protein
VNARDRLGGSLSSHRRREGQSKGREYKEYTMKLQAGLRTRGGFFRIHSGSVCTNRLARG